MANNQNLKSNSERTPRERKKLAKKAGEASGVSRRRRKSLGEAAQIAAKLPLNEIGINALRRRGLNIDAVDPDDLVGVMGLALGQMVAGINGNSQAAQVFSEWLELSDKHRRDQLEIERLKEQIAKLKEETEKIKAETERIRSGQGIDDDDQVLLFIEGMKHGDADAEAN